MVFRKTISHSAAALVYVVVTFAISFLRQRFAHDKAMEQGLKVFHICLLLALVRYGLTELRAIVRLVQSRELKPFAMVVVVVCLVSLGVFLFAIGVFFALVVCSGLLVWYSIRTLSKWIDWLFALLLTWPVVEATLSGENRVAIKLPPLDIFAPTPVAVWMHVPDIARAAITLVCFALVLAATLDWGVRQRTGETASG